VVLLRCERHSEADVALIVWAEKRRTRVVGGTSQWLARHRFSRNVNVVTKRHDERLLIERAGGSATKDDG
jgi:hypothetical protein